MVERSRAGAGLPRVLMLSKACIVGIYQRKLEEIASMGVDLLALVPPSWRDERGETPLERAYTQGYRLETLPLAFNGSFHFHWYRGLGTALRAFRPQIVHIDEEPYNLATWQALYHARRAGARPLFFSWQNIRRDYPPPFSWGERWVLNAVDHALAGTESAARVWREKGYRGPLTVIPQFGVDPQVFQPAPRPPRPFTLGYFGRMVEEKGLHVLVSAAAQLPAGSWRLLLVGSGPQLPALQARIAREGLAGSVAFQPPVPSTEMPARYHDIDAFVLPSLTRPNWKEQFGRVLIEAMSSGVPVVGSDSGAIPDVLGDAGLIFPEGDVDALAGCLRQLQADAGLRDCLAQKGRARVLARYTHTQIAAATVEVYRQMLAP